MTFTKLQNPPFLGSVITAWGLAVNWSLGGEKNCIVYSLFCVFIIIIITTTIISIIISLFPLWYY